MFLLCSDVLHPARIQMILQQNTDPTTATRELIAQAFSAGRHDNITAVVVRD